MEGFAQPGLCTVTDAAFLIEDDIIKICQVFMAADDIPVVLHRVDGFIYRYSILRRIYLLK